MTELNGRVFTRLKQYDALPAELKREAERLEEHLTTIQTQLFETHRTKTLKSIYGVRTRQLLEKIDAWIKQHGASTGGVGGVAHKGHVATTMKEQARDVKDHVTGKDHGHDATREGHGIHDSTHLTTSDHNDHGHGITHKDHGTAGHGDHGLIGHKDHGVMGHKDHGLTHKDHGILDHEDHGVISHKDHGILDHEDHGVISHKDPGVLGHEHHSHGLTNKDRGVVGHEDHSHGLTNKDRGVVGHKDHGVVGHEDHGHGIMHKDHGTSTHKDHHATTPSAPATNVGNYQTAASGTPATAPVHLLKPTDMAIGTHSTHAKKLLDALVLKGFVTPHKEDKHDEAGSTADDLKNSEWLVAVGKRITVPNNHSTMSVWDLVDGAIFAGFVKRKAGLLEPIIHGKDEYAVVNRRMRNLTLFKKDVSHKAKLQLEGAGMKVSFDKTHYENGVKVWTSSDSELFSLSSQRECDALVEALMAIGAVHDKGNGMVAKTAPEKIHDKVKDATTTDKHATHGTHATHGHGNKAATATAGAAAALHNKENVHHGTHAVNDDNLHRGAQGMTGDNLHHGTHGDPGHANKATAATPATAAAAGMHNKENVHHGTHGIEGDNLHRDHQGVMGGNLQHGHQGMTGDNIHQGHPGISGSNLHQGTHGLQGETQQHGTHGKNDVGQTNQAHGMTGDHSRTNPTQGMTDDQRHHGTYGVKDAGLDHGTQNIQGDNFRRDTQSTQGMTSEHGHTNTTQQQGMMDGYKDVNATTRGQTTSHSMDPTEQHGQQHQQGLKTDYDSSMPMQNTSGKQGAMWENDELQLTQRVAGVNEPTHYAP